MRAAQAVLAFQRLSKLSIGERLLAAAQASAEATEGVGACAAPLYSCACAPYFFTAWYACHVIRFEGCSVGLAVTL